MKQSFGKVSIKALAQHCGRDRSFMGRVLSGEKGVSTDTLHLMAKYLDLTMDETYEVLKRIRSYGASWERGWPKCGCCKVTGKG